MTAGDRSYDFQFAIVVSALVLFSLLTLATPKVYRIVVVANAPASEELRGESTVTRMEPLWVAPTCDDLGYHMLRQYRVSNRDGGTQHLYVNPDKFEVFRKDAASRGLKVELWTALTSPINVRFVGLNTSVLAAEVAASVCLGLIVWALTRRRARERLVG